jgi:hypothetical protein
MSSRFSPPLPLQRGLPSYRTMRSSLSAVCGTASTRRHWWQCSPLHWGDSSSQLFSSTQTPFSRCEHRQTTGAGSTLPTHAHKAPSNPKPHVGAQGLGERRRAEWAYRSAQHRPPTATRDIGVRATLSPQNSGTDGDISGPGSKARARAAAGGLSAPAVVFFVCAMGVTKIPSPTLTCAAQPASPRQPPLNPFPLLLAPLRRATPPLCPSSSPASSPLSSSAAPSTATLFWPSSSWPVPSPCTTRSGDHLPARRLSLQHRAAAATQSGRRNSAANGKAMEPVPRIGHHGGVCRLARASSSLFGRTHRHSAAAWRGLPCSDSNVRELTPSARPRSAIEVAGEMTRRSQLRLADGAAVHSSYWRGLALPS